MSHLYRHLRIHQVFGANTDVGKTVITAALVRASMLKNHNAFYLKPVSTGAPKDADNAYVDPVLVQNSFADSGLDTLNGMLDPTGICSARTACSDTMILSVPISRSDWHLEDPESRYEAHH